MTSIEPGIVITPGIWHNHTNLHADKFVFFPGQSHCFVTQKVVLEKHYNVFLSMFLTHERLGQHQIELIAADLHYGRPHEIGPTVLLIPTWLLVLLQWRSEALSVDRLRQRWLNTPIYQLITLGYEWHFHTCTHVNKWRLTGMHLGTQIFAVGCCKKDSKPSSVVNPLWPCIV